jgi:hypothetical protein
MNQNSLHTENYQKWKENKEYFIKNGAKICKFEEAKTEYIIAVNDIFVKNNVRPYLDSSDSFIQHNLACYYQNNGNESQMMQYLTLAAIQGLESSVVELAKIYADKKDYNKAKYYYELALMKNRRSSLLRKYAEFLFEYNIDKELAKWHLTAAASLGDVPSIHFLRKNCNISEEHWKVLLYKLSKEYENCKNAKLLKCIRLLMDDNTIIKYISSMIVENEENEENKINIKKSETERKDPVAIYLV